MAPPADLPEFVLDGRSFRDLAGFFDAGTIALGTGSWGRNLDAVNDILRGGFGTPEGGFVLRWPARRSPLNDWVGRRPSAISSGS